MKYLIFSDSHRNTAPMDAVIRSVSCDAVLHLGDVAEDVEHLRRTFFHKTVCAVCGNNDVFFREDPPKVFLEDYGHRIMLCHGHLHSVKTTSARLINDAKANRCDIVLFGHTHCAVNRTENGVLLVNPGSIGRNGTYAILTITDRVAEAEIKTVDLSEYR